MREIDPALLLHSVTAQGWGFTSGGREVHNRAIAPKVAQRMPPVPSPATELRFGEARAALADARTVLVLTSSASAAGEVVGSLQALGLPALMATRSREALYWLREVPPALVLVDMHTAGAKILLPELRRQGREVVALSDDSKLRQAALDAGCIAAHHATDSAAEVAQHVASLVRARDVKRIGSIVAGPLQVDLAARQLIFDGREVRVSPLLLNLAAHLAARAGSFVPASVLLEEVWGEPWSDHGKVQLAILRLRRRLPVGASSFIVSRRGHGYGLFPEQWRPSVLHAPADAKPR